MLNNDLLKIVTSFWNTMQGSCCLTNVIVLICARGRQENHQTPVEELCLHKILCALDKTILVSSMAHNADEGLETEEMDYRSLSSPKHEVKNFQYIHRVGVPPEQNLYKEFITVVKGKFFAHNPLHHYKDQTRSRKFILRLQAVFLPSSYLRCLA